MCVVLTPQLRRQVLRREREGRRADAGHRPVGRHGRRLDRRHVWLNVCNLSALCIGTFASLSELVCRTLLRKEKWNKSIVHPMSCGDRMRFVQAYGERSYRYSIDTVKESSSQTERVGVCCEAWLCASRLQQRGGPRGVGIGVRFPPRQCRCTTHLVFWLRLDRARPS